MKRSQNIFGGAKVNLFLFAPTNAQAPEMAEWQPLLTYVEEVQVPELSKLLIQRTEHAWFASFGLFVWNSKNRLCFLLLKLINHQSPIYWRIRFNAWNVL